VRITRHRHLEQEDVVTGAAAVALDLGLHAVRPDHVAEHLGASARAVAAAWPDEDALVAATFTRVVASELAEVKREVLSNPSPVLQLSVLLTTLAEPDRFAVDAVWLEAWSLCRHNTALRAAVHAEASSRHAFMAAVVRRGVRAGEYLEVDCDQVAAHLLAVIDGITAYSHVGLHAELDRLGLLQAVARRHLVAPVASEPAAASLSTV
jgi:AcrR family transcriptional regulator